MLKAERGEAKGKSGNIYGNRGRGHGVEGGDYRPLVGGWEWGKCPKR